MSHILSTEERIDKWKTEGIPADLQKMINMKMRVKRIIMHSHYNGTEIKAAAKMMGVKIRDYYKPYTITQEKLIRNYLLMGRSCAFIAKRMNINERVLRRRAPQIREAWPE